MSQTEGLQRRGRVAAGFILALVVLLVGGAVAAERLVEFPVLAPEPSPLPLEAAAAGNWYCPVTADDDESAVLTVAAVGDRSSTVAVTRYPGGVPVADPPVAVAPERAFELLLGPGEASNPVSVAWRGGPAVAHWRVDTGQEVAAAPCVSSPAPTWHLSGFDTRLGARAVLHLFNPFRRDATARLRFGTPEGPVNLVIADELLVPAGTSLAVDLVNLRPETADLGVTVDVLTGRLLPQGELELAPPGDDPGPRGRALLPAAPATSGAADFDTVTVDPVTSSWLSVYNPGEREAAVQLQVSDPLPGSALLSRELTVTAGGTLRVDLADVSAQTTFGVALRSVNEVGVVAARVTAITDRDRTGVAAALGAPAAAERWALVGAGSPTGAVGLYNPTGAPADVAVEVAGMTPATWTGISLAPNTRTELLLRDAVAEPGTLPAVVSGTPDVVAGVVSLRPESATAYWTNGGVPSQAWEGPDTAPPARQDKRLPTTPLQTGTAAPTDLPVDPPQATATATAPEAGPDPVTGPAPASPAAARPGPPSGPAPVPGAVVPASLGALLGGLAYQSSSSSRSHRPRARATSRLTARRIRSSRSVRSRARNSNGRR